MKTSDFNSKNYKTTTMMCLVLFTVHSSAFSQNKLVALASSVNFSFAIPIVCVLGLAVFLLTAFLKQKNH
ncbi:MAG: hypothetical protein HY062_02290 [Bacteroidetes bacterium]|nr:hypothetical protein [Bacteroidota bacterium]